jgi:periplasmic protein TonB
MPKMYHDIEGPVVRPTWPGTPARVPPVRSPLEVKTRNNILGLWKYPDVRRTPEVLWLAIFISLNAHLLLFFGFNDNEPPAPEVIADEGPVIQMAIPDLKDEDEEKPVEEISDAEADPDPGVVVPMLADVPTIVPMDAFTQKVEFQPAVQADTSGPKLTAIPVKIARSAVVEKLGKIFDLSQLDRAPVAIVQPPPVFPSNLKREYPEATVTVGFIVDAKGDVVAPYVVSSTYYGFEPAALQGVEKWKFRPGIKSGRKVNTRMLIDIKFKVTDSK